MSYYKGDYYSGRGDYYRGDPFLGALVPLAGGLLKKGVSALIAKAGARGATGAAAAVAGGAAAVGAASRLTSGGPIRLPAPMPGGAVIQPGRILPGGAPFITQGQAPRGYHAHKELAKRGVIKWVKNRYMNPANPKALRRAIRREEGFCQLAARFGLRRTRPAKLKVQKRKR